MSAPIATSAIGGCRSWQRHFDRHTGDVLHADLATVPGGMTPASSMGPAGSDTSSSVRSRSCIPRIAVGLAGTKVRADGESLMSLSGRPQPQRHPTLGVDPFVTGQFSLSAGRLPIRSGSALASPISSTSTRAR